MFSTTGTVASGLLSAVKTISDSKNSSADVIADRISAYQGTPLYGEAGLMLYYLKKHFALGLLIADPKVDVALLGKGVDTTITLEQAYIARKSGGKSGVVTFEPASSKQ